MSSAGAVGRGWDAGPCREPDRSLVPGWNPSSAADSVPSRPACPSFLSRGVGCGPPGSAAVSPELRASVTCLAKGLGPASTQEK